jgi:hypothetical protein
MGDAELDSPFLRQASVPLNEAVLHFDRTAHGVNHAAELNDAAVPGALNNAPVMHGDGWVDQVRSVRTLARIRSSSAPASRE